MADDSITEGIPSATVPRSGSRQTSSDTAEIYNLPIWQPDEEAWQCTYCARPFGMITRRHHCRKCGKVVCSYCSPHRIYMPSDRVVREDGVSSQDYPITGESAVLVRVCDTCVPPWTSNALPPYASTGWTEADMQLLSQFDGTRIQDLPPIIQEETRQRRRHMRAIHPAARDFYDSATLDPVSSSTIGNHRNPFALDDNSQRSLHTSSRSDAMPPSSPIHTLASRYPTLSSLDGLWSRSLQRSPISPISFSRSRLGFGNTSQPSSPLQTEQHDTTTTSRTNIAEEDGCPVCYLRLPSKQLANSDVLREQHITTCIETHLSTNATRRVRPPVTPGRSDVNPSIGNRDNPTVVRTSSRDNDRLPHHPLAPRLQIPSRPLSIANTPEARMLAREQAHAAVVLGQNASSSSASSLPGRTTGMVPYTATEKDCIDDAECTICLEEFEVGDSMARLECLCRFHKKCIDSWWMGKPNRCPVHGQDLY